MSPAAFGVLSILPLGLLFIAQALRLRTRMDTQANRRLLVRSGLFLGICALGSALLYARAGAVPMPFAWSVLLVLVVVGLLLSLLKRS